MAKIKTSGRPVFEGTVEVSHGLPCTGFRLEVNRGDDEVVVYLNREESLELVRAILTVLRERGEA
jgi:hypothetical protein